MIYSVNRKVVNNVAQLQTVLSQVKAAGAVVLLVERNAHLMYVPLQLD